MFPLASTRTGAKSDAIFAALGEICGLVYEHGHIVFDTRIVPPKTSA